MVTEHIKENEYTWTLASRFSDMLDTAESFFGFGTNHIHFWDLSSGQEITL